jgi:hypothetical protein
MKSAEAHAVVGSLAQSTPPMTTTGSPDLEARLAVGEGDGMLAFEERSRLAIVQGEEKERALGERESGGELAREEPVGVLAARMQQLVLGVGSGGQASSSGGPTSEDG